MSRRQRIECIRAFLAEPADAAGDAKHDETDVDDEIGEWIAAEDDKGKEEQDEEQVDEGGPEPMDVDVDIGAFEEADEPEPMSEEEELEVQQDEEMQEVTGAPLPGEEDNSDEEYDEDDHDRDDEDDEAGNTDELRRVRTAKKHKRPRIVQVFPNGKAKFTAPMIALNRLAWVALLGKARDLWLKVRK